MDHAGCVLWPLSKLLGRRFFKVMSDRTLVTCVIYDNKLELNYMICRILYANLLNHNKPDSMRTHKSKAWWFSSGDLPEEDPEIMFIPGDVIDSADGECSGTMYELSDQDKNVTELFEHFSGHISQLINSGRLSILYEISTDDTSLVRRVKARKETFDCIVYSYIHMWRLGHQVKLANGSLSSIFDDLHVPDTLMSSLSEYHTLLSRGNNSFPKLVPMTEAEVMRPYDITLKFWRECEMLLVSTDLCYMYLGTGMPLMSVVCPIYGMNREKYRNINIVRKFKMAEKMISDISEARVSLERNTLSDPRVTKLASLDQSEYTMTDIAGMIIMPYSGLSVSHVLTGGRGTIIKDSYLWALREKLLDPLVFKQLYLNWLVTLTNLHLIGGIIHGDLHAGNVTMYTNYTGYEQKYVIGDGSSGNDKITVLMQKSGEPYIGRIIDFSRSFITGHGPLKERHNDVALQTVLEEQHSRLLRSIERAVPEIYKIHRAKIETLMTTDPRWYEVVGIIDEIFLSKALLSIFNGLRDGNIDENYISSRVGDSTNSQSADIDDRLIVPKIDVHPSITKMLADFIMLAEKYILLCLVDDQSSTDRRYATKEFLMSDHFAELKCTEGTVEDIQAFHVGDSLDSKRHDTGACSENAGNRCMSSTFSFGTTIRDDVYMALLDAGDKFPEADKQKIRIMLDIHEKNDEWFALADRFFGN